MKNIKEFLKSNQAKTYYWTALNGTISLGLLYLADAKLGYAVFLTGLLNLITKAVNKKVKEINGG